MRQIDVRIVDPDGEGTFAADCADDLQGWIEELQPGTQIARPELPGAPGSKGAGLEGAQLAVTFTGAVAPLVAAIRGWRTINGTRTVSL